MDADGWSIAGTYLEACNCEAICPCRRVGGRAGGRSTYGVCTGALSWRVEDGHDGDVDLSGLNAVIACRYDDDEPGSPWTFFLYVDARGDERQRAALAGILSGLLAVFTQIQDPSVSLVPRVAAVGAAIALFAPAIASQLVAFSSRLWPLIAHMGTG